MEVFAERHTEWDSYTAREALRLSENAPHPLLCAWTQLNKEHRNEFPTLNIIRVFDGDAYVDEELWLAPDQVSLLLHEFRRLRRKAREEEFLSGISGQSLFRNWCSATLSSADEMNAWLDSLEEMLHQAVRTKGWVLFTI